MLIPDAEIKYLFSRSSGKGGQHVNTTESRVEAIWDFLESSILSDDQKGVLLIKLKSKLNAESCLHAVSEAERSQHRNKVIAVQKLENWVENALKKQKKRKATKVPKSVKEKRKLSKIKQSDKKKNRKKEI